MHNAQYIETLCTYISVSMCYNYQCCIRMTPGPWLMVDGASKQIIISCLRVAMALNIFQHVIISAHMSMKPPWNRIQPNGLQTISIV